ncbi:MAG: hypothetical protein HYV52_00890 [Parcubacteria group bacterium]|nr:hypothetical protein [Parcubacteria group bacterium]
MQEQIKDFEQKGLPWLEPAREFVLSLNQAAKLLESENKTGMTTFLKNIGSLARLWRELRFAESPTDFFA